MRSYLQLLSLSSRLYRLLLRIYPARFRRQYGPQMAQLFRDCSLQSLRDDGAAGLVKLWPLMFFDLLKSAVVEHLQRGAEFGRLNRFRLSGLAMIAGTVLLALTVQLDLLNPAKVRGLLYRIFSAPIGAGTYHLIRQTAENFGAILLATSAVLIAAGLVGLIRRYGNKVNRFGEVCLWLALLAALTIVAIVLVAPFAPDFIEDGGWMIGVFAPLLMALFLALFGLAALRDKPFARGNGLPLLTGVAPLLFIVEYIQIEWVNGYGVYGFLGPLWIAAAWFSGAGLLYLGFVLAVDEIENKTIEVAG